MKKWIYLKGPDILVNTDIVEMFKFNRHGEMDICFSEGVETVFDKEAVRLFREEYIEREKTRCST